MPETLTPDICVIGTAPGALEVATGAAALAVSAVLVDCRLPGDEGGYGGSLATTALLAAAKRAAVPRHSQTFGIKTSDTEIDFAAVIRHVRDAVAALAPNASAARLTGLGVRVIAGQARFADRRTVVVGEDIRVRARRFVIATGAAPAVPPISGLGDGPYFTTETIFKLKELPQRLVIIGAGKTGIELAQAFRRLGSDVTVLEAAQPLADFDPEAVDIVLAQLEREGVLIKRGVKIAHVSYIAHSVAVTVEADGRQEMVEGTHLLIAAGRKSQIDGLALDAARIRHDAAGTAVNAKLKTSNRRVFAIGDAVAGAPHAEQVAFAHASRVLGTMLLRATRRAQPGEIPRVVFTEPELAQAGLTEADVRQRRLKMRVLRWPFHDNARAQAEGTTHGHIKVICDNTGQIVGVTIVGPQAGELIATWNLAMASGVNISAMAGFALPYPTLSDVGKRVAMDFIMPRLTRSWARRIIAKLRIFG